jgi:hypothetical protein
MACRSSKQSTVRPTVPLFLESDDSKSFRPISPAASQQNGASGSRLISDRNSPVIPNIVPLDQIVPLLPAQGRSFSWTAVPRNNR